MATTRGYWNALRSTRNAIALRMGVDASGVPKDIRALANANLATVAVVIKALTDKGVITDADLTAARDAAIADIWDDEPNLP